MQATAAHRSSVPGLRRIAPDDERARRNTTGAREQPRRRSSFARLIPEAAAVKPDTRSAAEKSLDDLVEVLMKRGARTSGAVWPLLEAWCSDQPQFREQAMPLCVAMHVNLRRSFGKREGTMRGIVYLKTVMLLLGECACDLDLCVTFWLQGGDLLGLVYACTLTIILALSAYFFTGEGPITALLALTGLKVAVEARRALWEIAPGASSDRARARAPARGSQSVAPPPRAPPGASVGNRSAATTRRAAGGAVMSIDAKTTSAAAWNSRSDIDAVASMPLPINQSHAARRRAGAIAAPWSAAVMTAGSLVSR